MKNSEFSNIKVQNFYRRSLFFISKSSPEHIHHGFWDETTKNQKEARFNTVKFIVDCLEINDDDVVLDAGCGVGGTCRHIVSVYKVKTVGISISDDIEKAKEMSKNIENGHLLEFFKQDFTQSTFPDEFFTKIYVCESICYAPDKKALISELFRLLKKKGKIVILDAFQTKKNLNKKEKQIYQRFLKGWCLAGFMDRDMFSKELKHAGFKNINFQNKTKNVQNSIDSMYNSSKRWEFITRLLSKLKLIPEEWNGVVTGSINQKLWLENNIGVYGVFTAEK